jgi:dTDP-4-amino-4,6-dideoxygalactose transaminase
MSSLAIKGGSPIKTTPWPKWPVWQQSTLDAVESVFKSGRWAISSYYTPGTVLKEREFGRAFADFLGAKFCIPVASGSASLEMAMEALGIGAGDEVIIPSLTWVADAAAVMNVNAIPIFVDIDPATLCICASTIEAAITPRTRAVIAVHLYGCLCDLDAIVPLCRNKGIHLIEDCSHVHGARWRGKAAGTHGAIGCFSTQHTKLLPAGEGGVAVTDSPDLKRKLEQLKSNSRVYTDHPEVGKLEIEWAGDIMGSNYNLSEFQSAILLDGLSRLEDQNKRREENAKYLDDEFASVPGFTPIVPSDAVTRRAYYYYAIRCDQKYWAGVPTKAIAEALAAELMGAVETIYVPIHQSALFQPLTKKRFHLSDDHVAAIKRSLAANLPHTDEASRTIVSIPHQVLLADRSDMRQIIDAFAKVAAQKDQLGK